EREARALRLHHSDCFDFQILERQLAVGGDDSKGYRVAACHRRSEQLLRIASSSGTSELGGNGEVDLGSAFTGRDFAASLAAARPIYVDSILMQIRHQMSLHITY